MSRGLILAAPASGSGKTVITLALLRHLRRAGLRAAGAKTGPDYIDPAFHAAASGGSCCNLDAWAMRPATLARLILALGAEAEIVLCEGAMGLFDGAGLAAAGSTADVAALTGWPVVLVVDAARQGASVAALLRGFATHRREVPIGGVILNRMGSERHGAQLTAAIRAGLPDLAIFGAVPRCAGLVLPERHLGLVQAGEHAELGGFLDRAADMVAEAVDVTGLLAIARESHIRTAPSPTPLGRERASWFTLPPLGQRIAVARDPAFAFVYPAMLEGWCAAGAELAFFSPLADEPPPARVDAIYLPGGYPELHAARIAAADRFLDGLRAAAGRGAVIYGECGGYMVLGQGLVDAAGGCHAMAGLLPLETSFAERRLHLGYREARLATGGRLGSAGHCFRGHEFHYASILREGPGIPLFDATADADDKPLGPAGQAAGNVMGSFVHLVDCVA